MVTTKTTKGKAATKSTCFFVIGHFWKWRLVCSPISKGQQSQGSKKGSSSRRPFSFCAQSPDICFFPPSQNSATFSWTQVPTQVYSPCTSDGSIQDYRFVCSLPLPFGAFYTKVILGHWIRSLLWRRLRSIIHLCSSSISSLTSVRSKMLWRNCTMFRPPKWTLSFGIFFIFHTCVVNAQVDFRPDGKKKAYVRLTADHDALDVANKIGFIWVLWPRI